MLGLATTEAVEVSCPALGWGFLALHSLMGQAVRVSRQTVMEQRGFPGLSHVAYRLADSLLSSFAWGLRHPQFAGSS